MLDRRQILLGVAALMGGSLLPTTVKALSSSDSTPANRPVTLSERHLKTITVVADIIIPETETPGASGAGVPAFIGRALFNWWLPEERKSFLAGLDNFLRAYPDFLARNKDAQTKLVGDIDSQLEDLPEEVGFYRQLKELVLIGYYTSEVGATEELDYDPVPGGYKVFEVTSETKAWST